MNNALQHTQVCYYHYEKKLHVGALADRLLFTGDGSTGGALVFLSILGPHSAVKGLLAAAASRCDLRAPAAWPNARFYGRDGGRIVTHALSREVTHGVYLSPELVIDQSRGEATVVDILDPTPRRVLDRLNHAFALTVKADWSDWFASKLESSKLLMPLSGFGATGCRITAGEEQLDKVIAAGVASGDIRF